ncbi:MAG: PfkB family carbohydrate kinase [Pseudomonadota bacterium]|nr:PfkB family carbohydrate kinase [Pseudomonadota bacterium]
MASISASPILCIGGAVVDRILETIDAPKVATSNPVRSRMAHGGVARNVAHNLARLGCRVSLASLIGNDAAGKGLKAAAEAAGIDCQYLRSVADARTAEYTAVFHRGELFAAFADMAIFDDWPAASMDKLAAALGDHAWVFADCNLPSTLLAQLTEMRKSQPFRLAVDAVSVAKSARLGKDLSHLDVLFLNRDEARAMSGSQEPEPAMRQLRERGAGCVVLTSGAAGAHALAGGPPHWVPAAAANAVNVSGAGDALIAGTLLRLAENASLAIALEFGAACAGLALSSPEAVTADLSREKVERSMLPERIDMRSEDAHD